MNHSIRHSRHRAAQRYGIKLSRNVAARIVADILSGRAHLLGVCDEHGRPDRRMYAVTVGKKKVNIVFDPQSKKIITVLGRRNEAEA